MAKRVPPEEKPYRPLDFALVHSVLNPSPALAADEEDAEQPAEHAEPASATVAAPSPKVLPMPKRRADPAEEDRSKPEAERLTREKRFLLTPSEDEELERIVSEVARSMGTTLKPSHMIRAMNIVLRHVSEELKKQSLRGRPMKRPPNGDVEALAAFEHYLAQLIETAIRNSKPLK